MTTEKTDQPTVVVIDLPNMTGGEPSELYTRQVLESCNRIAQGRSSRILMKVVFVDLLSNIRAARHLAKAAADFGFMLLHCEHVGGSSKETVDVRIMRFLEKMAYLSTRPVLFMLASADADFSDVFNDLRDLGHAIEIILPNSTTGTPVAAKRADAYHSIKEATRGTQVVNKTPAPDKNEQKRRIREEKLVRIRKELLPFLQGKPIDHPNRKAHAIKAYLIRTFNVSEKKGSSLFGIATSPGGGLDPAISKRQRDSRVKNGVFFLLDEVISEILAKTETTEEIERRAIKIQSDQRRVVTEYLSDLSDGDTKRGVPALKTTLATRLKISRKDAGRVIALAIHSGWIEKRGEKGSKLLYLPPY